MIHALAASSEPLRALAIKPLAALGPPVRCRVDALAMLLAVHPRAFVLTSIGPIDTLQIAKARSLVNSV